MLLQFEKRRGHTILSSLKLQQNQKKIWSFVYWFCSPNDVTKRRICNDFLFSFTVANLPHISSPDWHSIYRGAMSMPSVTGDGVYLRAGEYLFLFTCDESSCQWTTVKEGLETAIWGVMMPLPSDYTCE